MKQKSWTMYPAQNCIVVSARACHSAEKLSIGAEKSKVGSEAQSVADA